MSASESDKCISIRSVKSTFFKPEKLLFKKSIFLESDNPLQFHVTSLAIIIQKEISESKFYLTQHGVMEKQKFNLLLSNLLFTFFDLFLPLSGGQRCDESLFLGRRSQPSSSCSSLQQKLQPHMYSVSTLL